jgi:ATP-dependent DNA ligase
VHEIKFDGYRIAARIDHGQVQLLTRSGLDWTAKYPATASALAKLPVKTAYIDGELCGVRPDGVTSFEMIQQASDGGAVALVYYAFDLLELDGAEVASMTLLERKDRLAKILKKSPAGIAFSEHEGGDGEAFRRAACRHGLEGIVSKRTNHICRATAVPGSRPSA